MNTYQIVRNLANSKDMTIAELERKLNFSNGQIRRWQKANPNAEHLRAIADYFDVSVDYLLGRNKDEYEGEKEDEEIRIMHRGVKNMSKEDRDKALKMFETFFDNWDEYTKDK